MRRQSSGFTIVELLVVIVIIGILAAITIVAYTGISQRAIAASLQSDLANAAKQIKLYQITNSLYPTANECPIPSAGNICLKSSSSNTFTYVPNNAVNPPTFSLTDTNTNGVAYVVTESTTPTLVVAPAGPWQQITTGTYHNCATNSINVAYCWGYNNNGQLGNNSTTESHVPVAVNTAGVLSGKTISSISAGDVTSCAIASDNKAYCWGHGSYGDLGNNSTAQSTVPVAVYTSGVLSGKTILSISVGSGFACVIASDNKAYCWGYATQGQLGNNSITQSAIPVAVDTTGVLSGKTILSISTSTYHACVVASDNKAYCWGYNNFGQLGNNSTTQSNVPVAVDATGVLSGKTVIAISAGEQKSCAIASDNKAYCWGLNNTYGGLGNNSTVESHVPVAVDTTGALSGKTVTSISVASHVCVIASDNKAYCWGYGAYGQLGINSTANSLVPVAVDTTGVLSGKTVTSMKSGGMHSCAMSSDSQAYCWGWNWYGQIGDNSTTQRTVPVAVVSP
jgi:prepilin-type N-terminal cleavage/methylation domain-containing protein